MKHRGTVLRWLGALALLAFWIPCALAGGPDEQWSITVATTMAKPMQMTLPEMTSKSCRPAKKNLKPPPMKNSDCKLDHYDRTGNKISFGVSCHMKAGTMKGEGWSQLVDAGHMKGSMHLTGVAGGMPMDMTMDYHGKRIGSCTAEPSAN